MFHVSKFLSLKSLHFNFALIKSVSEPTPGKESKIIEVGVGGEQSRTPSPCRFYKNAPYETITDILSLVHVTLTLVFTSVYSLGASEIF